MPPALCLTSLWSVRLGIGDMARRNKPCISILSCCGTSSGSMQLDCVLTYSECSSRRDTRIYLGLAGAHRQFLAPIMPKRNCERFNHKISRYFLLPFFFPISLAHMIGDAVMMRCIEPWIRNLGNAFFGSVCTLDRASTWA